ncbi:hypothetical protein OC835_004586 [Tilletia horrida]|nr:hypothetical protein OC835_004586 [Tilletia horrida]
MPVPALPSELILKIVGKALVPEFPDLETYSTYGRRIRELSSVSKTFKMATQLNLNQHFHPFRTDDGPLVRARLIPWLPDPRDVSVTHRDWWDRVARQPLEDIHNIERAHAAVALTDFKTVRTLSLDLRISRVHADNNARLWAKTQVPQWVMATAILTRLSTSAQALEELHLRLPPQQDMIPIVEDIVAKNSNLRSIIIEIDSANQPYSVFRPMIDLSRVCKENTPYRKFSRFIIRAPSTRCIIQDSTPFFYRLGDVEEFALSVAELDTPLRNWQWARKALHNMPKIQRFDVSVFTRNSASKPYAPQHDAVTLPHLTDLVLELKDVDSNFLVKVTADNLLNLRIQSAVDIDDWPCLSRNQLPSLFCVNVRCPGNSAMRMDVLGIPRSKYSQNLSDFHNYSVSHSQDFLAYIQPYGRTRRLTSLLIPDSDRTRSATSAATTTRTQAAASTATVAGASATGSRTTTAVHEPADVVDSTDSDSDTLTTLDSDTDSGSDGEGHQVGHTNSNTAGVDGGSEEGLTGGTNGVNIGDGNGVQVDSSSSASSASTNVSATASTRADGSDDTHSRGGTGASTSTSTNTSTGASTSTTNNTGTSTNTSTNARSSTSGNTGGDIDANSNGNIGNTVANSRGGDDVDARGSTSGGGGPHGNNGVNLTSGTIGNSSGNNSSVNANGGIPSSERVGTISSISSTSRGVGFDDLVAAAVSTSIALQDAVTQAGSSRNTAALNVGIPPKTRGFRRPRLESDSDVMLPSPKRSHNV